MLIRILKYYIKWIWTLFSRYNDESICFCLVLFLVSRCCHFNKIWIWPKSTHPPGVYTIFGSIFGAITSSFIFQSVFELISFCICTVTYWVELKMNWTGTRIWPPIPYYWQKFGFCWYWADLCHTILMINSMIFNVFRCKRN